MAKEFCNLATLQLSLLGSGRNVLVRDTLEAWSVNLSGIFCAHVNYLKSAMTSSHGYMASEDGIRMSNCQRQLYCDDQNCNTVCLSWDLHVEKEAVNRVGKEFPISGIVNTLLQRLQKLGYRLKAHNETSQKDHLHATWTFEVQEFIRAPILLAV